MFWPIEQSQGDQFKKYSVFENLQLWWQAKVCKLYNLGFSNLMMSQLQNYQNGDV